MLFLFFLKWNFQESSMWCLISGFDLNRHKCEKRNHWNTSWCHWCRWWNRFAAFSQQWCKVSLTRSQTQVCLCASTHIACQTGVTQVTAPITKQRIPSHSSHECLLWSCHYTVSVFVFHWLSSLGKMSRTITRNRGFQCCLSSACCVVDCLQTSVWHLSSDLCSFCHC